MIREIRITDRWPYQFVYENFEVSPEIVTRGRLRSSSSSASYSST